MTPAELELAARQNYNAVGDTHFTTAEFLVWIYRACMILSNETFCIEDTFTTASVSGTREYSYPTNAMSIRRVEYDGQKLQPVSLEADPKTNTTAPTGRPGQYAIWEGDLILFPTPSTSSLAIKVFAYCRPQAVTASSVLEVPEEYHPDIIDFILAGMYAKDTNHQMSTFHRNLWDASINRIKRQRSKKLRGDQYAVVRDVSFQSDLPGTIV